MSAKTYSRIRSWGLFCWGIVIGVSLCLAVTNNDPKPIRITVEGRQYVID